MFGRRVVSFRRNLLGNIVLMIVLLSGALMVTTFVGAKQKVTRLAESLASRTLDNTERQLNHFFGPMADTLVVMRSRGAANPFSFDDPIALTRFFVPLIQRHPAVSAVMIADQRGREFMLLRAGKQWQTRLVQRDVWGTRSRRLEWADPNADPVETWQELDYDPRLRPWYQGAIAECERCEDSPACNPRDRVHWTAPYEFFTLKEPGITASIALDTGDGLQRVIGFDLSLRDISAFTRQLEVGPRGKLFVLAADRRIIGLPNDPRFETAEARTEAILKRPAELGMPVVIDAARVLAGVGQTPQGAAVPDDVLSKPFPFPSGGEAWWGAIRPFQLGPGRQLWMAAVIPQADLVGDVRRVRIAILLATLGVLAVAIVQAIRVARRYSQPVEALVRRSERIARGDLDRPEPIASPIAEMRHLAETQDRMRVALRSLLKLERDLQLAALIQRSTFPEDLPSLPGFQIDAYSQPAEETGGDTYDVIGCERPEGGPIIVSVEQADRAVLLMADATGHGIGPALSVTQVRAMLRMAVRSGVDLATIAFHINEQLCDDLPTGRFITAWLAVVDAADRTLTSFSAGQGPLLYYSAEKNAFDVWQADTLPFGIMQGWDISLRDPLRLRSGDIFAVLSDGIFEATNPESEQFGLDRVTQVLSLHRQAASTQILQALRAAVTEFAHGVPTADDQTAMIIKCVEG